MSLSWPAGYFAHRSRSAVSTRLDFMLARQDVAIEPGDIGERRVMVLRRGKKPGVDIDSQHGSIVSPGGQDAREVAHAGADFQNDIAGTNLAGFDKRRQSFLVHHEILAEVMLRPQVGGGENSGDFFAVHASPGQCGAGAIEEGDGGMPEETRSVAWPPAPATGAAGATTSVKALSSTVSSRITRSLRLDAILQRKRPAFADALNDLVGGRFPLGRIACPQRKLNGLLDGSHDRGHQTLKTASHQRHRHGQISDPDAGEFDQSHGFAIRPLNNADGKDERSHAALSPPAGDAGRACRDGHLARGKNSRKDGRRGEPCRPPPNRMPPRGWWPGSC